MKKFLLVCLVAATVATPAVARLHAKEERDSVVRLCKAMYAPGVDLEAVKRTMDKMQADASISPDDKDYVADICWTYGEGLKDGRQQASS